MDDLTLDIKSRTAFSDIEHRAWVLRKGIWDYMKLFSRQIQNLPTSDSYSLDQKRHNSETDRELENILLNAKQWYKTISSTDLPRDIRRSIKSSINTDLKETVEHLRDIREHWENTRKYFKSNEIDIPPSQSKVIWFKKKYPDANPWSSGMSVGIGYFIAGPEVLNLHNLLLEADRVDSILQANQ